MALLSGGGYAEYAKCKLDQIMTIPDELDVIQAAAIPEVWLTAFQNCKLSNLSQNDVAVVHAAASGVGTALIQLIKHYKAKPIALCSTEDKIEYCNKLGATLSLNRKDSDIKERILNDYKGGCNVIYDCVGASAFDLVN
jgi:tumor protein p53-inducible protein 3